MSTPRPAERLYVTLHDQQWELVPTHKLLGPELREAKRVSKVALVPMEQGLKDMDYDCWFAWLYVSIRRQWPTLTESDLEEAIGDTPLVALVESITREAPEVAAPDPPAQPPANGGVETTNGDGSGEKTPLPSISEISGHPS